MIDPRQPDFTDRPGSLRRPAFHYAPLDVSAPSLADPPVSIVTPYYNTGEIFHETAACVLGQSFANFEWIIVDDGSTKPEAIAALDRYRNGDARIRIVTHDVNRGLSAARNTGYRAARGRYVLQLDSDDLIEPTALEKSIWFLESRPQFSFVKGWTVGFGAEEYLYTRGFHEGATFLTENLVTPNALVRRGVFEDAGGYDESNRGGLEDWAFWLAAAERGHWGGTIPEYLDWYRRRAGHWNTWANLADDAMKAAFMERLREHNPGIFAQDGRNFPKPPAQWHMCYEAVKAALPVHNPLAKKSRRLLMIVPWLQLGGADKFNLAMIRQLRSRAWEVTVATTLHGDHSWLPEFTRETPDVFATPHFLHPSDTPVFLRYLIESRRPDVVMVSNSELGYMLLPYLRTVCPEPSYVDYCHMEEVEWKNGGYPRYCAGANGMLDLSIVSSEHLKRWTIGRGGRPERIEVCHTCEDAEQWTRDEERRSEVRARHGLGEGEIVILHAGRIVAQKQPQVLAGALKALRDSGARFTCLVAGDGPDMPFLRGFVTDNALNDHVRLLGSVPNDHIKDLMSAGDIFFLPSRWEGIALSVFESMSMGMAVVTANVGGQREVVDSTCGVVVERASESEEIAAYAGVLADLCNDPDRCRALGAAARRRILCGFRLSDMGGRMDELLRRAIGGPRAFVPRENDLAFAPEAAARAVEYLRAFHLADSLWIEREGLWRERDVIRAERDAACRERDQLRSQLQSARARANGLAARPDPRAEAERLIAENVRYRLADRVNNTLKGLKVQTTIKKITMTVLPGRHRSRHDGT